MDFKIDIKLLITLLIMATTIGGFYYTTQLRLDTLETSVEECQSGDELKQLKKQLQNLTKRFKRLESK
tara:strand:+ start:131 stop:334 length:204 start_codon:yes stop_codon:yes gene_type:complete